MASTPSKTLLEGKGFSEKEGVPPKRLRGLGSSMGVGDVTSPIAVLGITDFGNNWGETWLGIASEGWAERHQFWQVNRFFISGETCVSRDPLEAQSGIVGEGGGKRPNIPEGLR